MEQIIEKANQTRSDFTFVPASEQIHRQAVEHPEKTAVIVSGRKISYSELDRKSNCVANMLLSRRLGENALVGVLLDRSEYAYYAEQGILKARAAFLPFITSYPDDRINFCMEDGDVAVLLTSRKVMAEHAGLSGKGFEIICMEDIPGIDGPCDESLAAYPSADSIGRNNLAYCIYTSGSTGRPKGVLIEQGNLANYVQKDEKSIEIMHYASPGMVSLAMAAFSFDVSIVEQFVPLCNGNTVCMATEEEIHNPVLLAKTIIGSGVTGITCTPTFLMNIVDIDICREALRQIRFYDIGAEAFPS
jgi:non-ribosomal peptide synthetase component F